MALEADIQAFFPQHDTQLWRVDKGKSLGDMRLVAVLRLRSSLLGVRVVGVGSKPTTFSPPEVLPKTCRYRKQQRRGIELADHERRLEALEARTREDEQ